MDLETASAISRPPSAFQQVSDRLFRGVSFLFAWATILAVLYIVWEIGGESVPAMERYGLGFLTGRTWDPNTDEYGILPQIWRTLYSSLLALLIGTVLGVAVAIFLNEGYLGGATYQVLKLLGVQLHPLWARLPSALENLLRIWWRC